MQTPLKIVFEDIPSSPAIETQIRERADALDRFFPGIVSCRVTVGFAARRQHRGNLYHVSVLATVPGSEIVVNRAPAEHHAHEDVYVAIRDAFDEARRQLEDHARRRRGDTKTHRTSGQEQV